MMDQELIRQGVRNILIGLGLDPTDENLIDTPDRIVKTYEEVFVGLVSLEAKVDEILSKTFPCSYSEVVVAKNIDCFSFCPHHLLPVRYNICVGYLPTERVLGLSKLCRLVGLLAARPILHEQLMEDITEQLMRIKGCKGAACIGTGEHYCITMRGAKQTHSCVVASSLKGVFFEQSPARAEFLQLFRGG
jgi:GTP cyclohydrolase I